MDEDAGAIRDGGDIDPLEDAGQRMAQAQLDIVRLIEAGMEPRTIVVSIRKGGTDTIVLSDELTPEDVWLAVEARRATAAIKDSLNRPDPGNNRR